MVSHKVDRVAAPSIQVSWGELIDKITILEIKEQRLLSKQSVANVHDELAALMSVADRTSPSERWRGSKQLKSINETLWKPRKRSVQSRTIVRQRIH
jgi:hypothetical protein